MSGPQDPADRSHPRDQEVGDLGEEAAKLLGALAEWASDSARGLDAHLATGDAECLYCPICRTVHAVRQASPEVRAHLATAASSFLQAASGLLASASGGTRPATSVQRIDLDDAADDDLDWDLDPGVGGETGGATDRDGRGGAGPGAGGQR